MRKPANQVSVIMTAYNASKTIDRAIQSLLESNDRLDEIVVVDDGSDDNTLGSLQAYSDDRVRVYAPGRLGRARALQYAVERTEAAYIANLDADDECLPGRLDKQAAFLDDESDVAWVGSAEEMVDERRDERFIRRYPQEDAMIRRQAAKCIPYSHSAVMFRRSLLEEKLNYDPTQPYLIDFEFFLRVAARHKVANLPEPLVRRYVRTESYFQSTFSTARQNRRLARLSARAVRLFGLPASCYVFPLARLVYPWLPGAVKRRVRNLQGLQETDLLVES